MGQKKSKPQTTFPQDHGSSSSQSSSEHHHYSKKRVRSGLIDKLQQKYSKIGDDFDSLSQVTDALANAGLESSNLIVGIDFTKSNEWTGRVSFGSRSLHDLGVEQNPYEQAISIIGRTLSTFDEDNLIPCYGFGDGTTRDKEVFSFNSHNRPCNGFEEALLRYREIVPYLHLAGPTSFAPIIETAISIVDNAGGQYHVLLLIADGQVTPLADKARGKLSPQERDTIDAIVKASNYPLSIVMVGVGDGPWEMMQEFDDNIPSRAFDNFQFVNFTEIMSGEIASVKKETQFALAALMEIPSQYKATMELQLLGKRRGTKQRAILPPPVQSHGSSVPTSRPSQPEGFKKDAGCQTKGQAATSESSQANLQMCPVCRQQAKNLAFGCGHQTCDKCGRDIKACPVCQTQIATRIKLL